MAFVGDRWDDSPAGSEELFDFGVVEFGEVVEDLVVVLVLHGCLLRFVVCCLCQLQQVKNHCQVFMWHSWEKV